MSVSEFSFLEAGFGYCWSEIRILQKKNKHAKGFMPRSIIRHPGQIGNEDLDVELSYRFVSDSS